MIFEFNIKFWAKIAQKKPLGDVSTASKRHREVSKTYFFQHFFIIFGKWLGFKGLIKNQNFQFLLPKKSFLGFDTYFGLENKIEAKKKFSHQI